MTSLFTIILVNFVVLNCFLADEESLPSTNECDHDTFYCHGQLFQGIQSACHPSSLATNDAAELAASFLRETSSSSSAAARASTSREWRRTTHLEVAQMAQEVFHLRRSNVFECLAKLLVDWNRDRIALLLDTDTKTLMPISEFEKTLRRNNILSVAYYLDTVFNVDRAEDSVFKTNEVHYVLLANSRNTDNFLKTAFIHDFLTSNNTLIILSDHLVESIERIAKRSRLQITLLTPLKNDIPVSIHPGTYSTNLTQCSVSVQFLDSIADEWLNPTSVAISDVFYGTVADRVETLEFARWRSARFEFLNLKTFDVVKRLRGRTFRAVTFDYQPFVNIDKSKNVRGLMKEAFDVLSTWLNFRLEYNIKSDATFGTETSPGQYDGIVGNFHRREADIAVTIMALTASRLRVIKYVACPMVAGSVSMFMRRPKPYSSVTAYVSPFTTSVWLISGCVALLILATLVFVQLVGSPYQQQKRGSPSTAYWFFSGVFLETSFANGKNVSTKCVAGILLVFGTILLYHYSSVFISFVSVVKVKLPFDTLDQAIENREYKCAVLYGEGFHELLKNSRSGLYARTWGRLKEDDDAFVGTIEEGVSKVSAGGHVFLGPTVSTGYVVHDNCDIISVPLKYKGHYYFVPIRKDFPYATLLTESMRRLFHVGIMSRLGQRYYLPVRGREQCGTSRQKLVNFGLREVEYPFQVLWAGIMASLVALVLECLHHRLVRKSSSTFLTA